jgi:co-chaperonin GroES (HSP10)
MKTASGFPWKSRAGDRVLFSKYAGTEIKIDGVEHIFMREDDILAMESWNKQSTKEEVR